MQEHWHTKKIIDNQPKVEQADDTELEAENLNKISYDSYEVKNLYDDGKKTEDDERKSNDKAGGQLVKEKEDNIEGIFPTQDINYTKEDISHILEAIKNKEGEEQANNLETIQRQKARYNELELRFKDKIILFNELQNLHDKIKSNKITKDELYQYNKLAGVFYKFSFTPEFNNYQEMVRLKYTIFILEQRIHHINN